MKRKYQNGGVGLAVDAAANILQTQQYTPEGDINTAAMMGAPALKGAATGFAVGGPIGAGIGLVAGAASGLISANKAKDELERVRRAEAARKENADRMLIASYPTQGVNTTNTYYKCGGKRRMSAGGIVPVGMTGMAAKGPSHEQGGVDIGGAEVEGGEVAMRDGNMEVWFSDRIGDDKGTFAEQAASLLEQKATYEQQLNGRDKQAVIAARRAIEDIDMQLASLAAAQRAQQDAMGIPANGQMGAYGTSVQRAVPYLDNLVNTAVIAATPQVPAPVYQQAPDLVTNYNVADQLNEIRRGRATLNTALDRSTSGQSISRTNRIAANLEGTNQTNRILGEKQRIETQLQNQDILNKQQVDARNIEMANRQRLLGYQRADAIGQRISQNAANATEDAMAQITEDRLQTRDLAQLELLKKRYEDLGLWDRNMSKGMEQFVTGEISYEEFQSILNRKDMTTAPIARRSSSVVGRVQSLPARTYIR